MRDGFSPFFLMYGTNYLLSRGDVLTKLCDEAEIIDSMVTVSDEFRAAMLLTVDAHRADRLTKVFQNFWNPYRVRDTVLMLKPNWCFLLPLTSKWGGPFVISRVAGLLCWLQDEKKHVTNKGNLVGRVKLNVARN